MLIILFAWISSSSAKLCTIKKCSNDEKASPFPLFSVLLFLTYSLIAILKNNAYCKHYPSAGNNSQSTDIVPTNFENVRPISHSDQTQWLSISPAHLELYASRFCWSINYVHSSMSNVQPEGRFQRTYVL